MIKIEKSLVCLFALMLLFACSVNTNDQNLSVDECEINTLLAPRDAMEDFSIILSKAVADNEALRLFIKEQAMLCFDNDYDVLYQAVKSVMVSREQTFRDILLKYCDECQLATIEYSLPKLTILVPDFSWVDSECFSILAWDPHNPQIAVGFDDREDKHPIYYAGELVCEIPKDDFPSFPTLIVKDNERIRSIVATKSGIAEYSFVDPAFDGSKRKMRTKGGLWGDIDEVLDNDEDPGVNLVSQVGNTISASELSVISPKTVLAYDEFGTGWGNACQRDYIYYGMSQTNTNNGVLDLFQRDMIYRIALSSGGLWSSGDAQNEDVAMQPGFVSYNSDLPDCADAVRRMWGNGNYEIKIEIYQQPLNSSPQSIGVLVFTISPSDLMYVTKCNRNYHWNILGQSWNTYTLNQSYIEPKWYYPNQGALYTISNGWDLSSNSDNIFVRITEVDQSVSYSYTQTVSFKHTDAVSTSTQTNPDGSQEEVKIKGSYGVSGSTSTESTDQQTFTYTRKESSDTLGTLLVGYIDNVITAKNGNVYNLKRYSTGNFYMSIIPIDTRDEYLILNYLNSSH